MGEVCSAGVLILACAPNRLVTESCVLISHSGRGEVEGTHEDMKARIKYYDWSELHWADLMARYTPEDASWWKLKTKRESERWYFGGPAIVAAGLADSVITDKIFS